VGVTPPSIYLHFADKTELIFAVCEEHFRRLDEVMDRAGNEVDQPLASLRARGLAYIRFGLDNPVAYRILFQSKDTPDGYHATQLGEQAAFRHLVDAVQRCLDAGIFRPGDPQRLAFALWSAAHGMVSLMLAAPESPWGPPDELAQLVIEMAGLGLAVGGSMLPLPPDIAAMKAAIADQ
jgi:AcrR family transcriptional regulator